MSFGHLPGAFLEIFFWFQKATLGTRLPLNVLNVLNVSRRPRLPLNLFPGALGGPAACPLATCRALSWEIFFWFQKATLGTRLPLNVLNVLNVSRRPRLPLNLFPGALGGPAACPLATCRALSWEIFFWFQKATLGTRLPLNVLNVLNVSRRPRLPLNLFPGALGGPAACPLATCRALSWRFSSGFRKQR